MKKFTIRAGHTAISVAVLLFLCILIPGTGAASGLSLLAPDDVALVVNTRNPHSKTLALYYMQKRFVPWRNLITIDTVEGESCSRQEYEKNIARPVRVAIRGLEASGQRIRCILLVYGVPLKIRQTKPCPEDSNRLQELKKKKSHLIEEKNQANASKTSHREVAKITAEIRKVQLQINNLNRRNTRASVDSELSLVMAGRYPLAGWIPNPLFQAYGNGSVSGIRAEDVMMVSRIDGPDPATVRRIVDDSIAAERSGLSGIAYFDARWKEPKDKKRLSGYALYDAAIHHAADLVARSSLMQVVTDDTQKLFQPGQCPHAAIYCGWYSLAKYVDAFQWQQGAVGYHIASAECRTLKRKGSTVWCKKMLEKGIAATLGPVFEPYVQAFPFPDMFFATLIYTGASVAEAYWSSLPYTSWQMVLIADPLYRPFARRASRGFR